MTRHLSTLRPGECGIVVQLLTHGPIRRRLSDLGFTVGTTVSCLFRSPLGDPTAYNVKGAVIALRREDADTIVTEIKRRPLWN